LGSQWRCALGRWLLWLLRLRRNSRKAERSQPSDHGIGLDAIARTRADDRRNVQLDVSSGLVRQDEMKCRSDGDGARQRAAGKGAKKREIHREVDGNESTRIVALGTRPRGWLRAD